ncbi:hypothetical protein QQ045_025297 [Rhodiola kirilowii]
MAKAYDRVSWSFSLGSFHCLGFNEQWCDLIYRCISNCWYTVRWDGNSYDFFKSYQGVRQGDPLSPSLFIIAMDCFSRSLNAAVSLRTILPYYTKCRNVLVNHLLYADDLLIFTNVYKRSIANLLSLIDQFCIASGQSLNPAKSQIFFSDLIPQERKTTLLHLTHFQEGSFPVLYLGAPLFNGMAKIEHFNYLVDRVQDRAEGWICNFLSMAGRVTLGNLVLSSLSIHCMAILPVPKTVLKRIERILANFIWGHGGNHRKHWIGWPRICRSKYMGGLGVISLSDMTLAFRSKLAWSYISPSSLWSRFEHDKFTVGKLGSPIWNSFNHLIEPLQEQSKWLIGNDALVVAIRLRTSSTSSSLAPGGGVDRDPPHPIWGSQSSLPAQLSQDLAAKDAP